MYQTISVIAKELLDTGLLLFNLFLIYRQISLQSFKKKVLNCKLNLLLYFYFKVCSTIKKFHICKNHNVLENKLEN